MSSSKCLQVSADCFQMFCNKKNFANVNLLCYNLNALREDYLI